MAEVILFQYLSPKFLLKRLSCSLPKTDRAQSDPTDLFLLANFQLFSYILYSNHTSLLAVLWKHRGSHVHQGLSFGCSLPQDKSYLTYPNSSFLQSTSRVCEEVIFSVRTSLTTYLNGIFCPAFPILLFSLFSSIALIIIKYTRYYIYKYEVRYLRPNASPNRGFKRHY